MSARPDFASASGEVTVVVSDLKGSTALGETLDAESLRVVLSRYFDEMREIFESYGGTIEKIIGDAIVAVFGLSGDEDHPAQAVSAVCRAESALVALNDDLEQAWGVRLTNRTGIATGPVVVGEAAQGRQVLSGEAMEVAEALESAAPGMRALMSPHTHELVAPQVESEFLPEVRPKNGDPRPAWLLDAFVGVSPAPDRTSNGVLECPHCGHENPGSQRRCSECGTVLTSASSRKETRRTVTVLFADPRPVWEDEAAASAAAVEDVMTRYFDEMRGILEGHGATVEKFIGDALMAVFGIPVRHEDDALRAVRAAADMRAALPRLNEQLAQHHPVRLLNPIGVNTGEVVAGDAALGQRLVTGDTVNVAARLEQTAAAGDVVLGALTERLIRGHVTTEAVAPLTLKGKAEPVPAFRLVDVGDRRPRREPITTPMVGRDDELAALEEIATETVDERRCRVVTLVGDAGVGKSRLTEEFLAVVADGSGILRGRCLPYGDGITFWPVVELIRGAAAIRDEDPPEVARAKIAGLLAPGQADIADRLASLLGLAAVDYQVAELFWAIRRFLEIVAAERPLVVLFDDVHWAEDTFLELVEHLAASVADAAVTLLCTARPDFLVEHADWLPAGLRIALEPLSDDAAARVVENLLGSVGLDREICDRVVAAAQGNPLFVEQLLSMLIDEGRLELVDGTWRAPGDLASFELPPSIDALIAARLDRLSTDERGVVDPASVIGQAFATDAVRALVDASLRDGVPSALDGLTERQLLTEAPEASELDYRFHHILVRDAAYRGLLKQTRAVLHERFVTWADEVNRERGREAEFEEILGYHLESAHRYWAELGPLDEHGRALGICASERLGSAGARAFARGDIPAAAGLLERAGDLLPEDHPELPGLRIQEGEAHFQEGDFARAEDRFAAAEHHARHGGRPALALAAHMERLRMGYATGAGLHSDDVAGEAREAIRELETLGDHGGLARAWRVLTSIEFTAERWGAAEESAREMLRHAAAAGNTTMELRVLPILALTALYGPTPVPEAIEMCEELLTRTRDDRRAGTFTLLPLARLLAMRGDFDEARSIYRRAWRTLSELGWAFQAALVSLDSGVIELQAGDPAAAEKELRRDYDAFAAMGETNYIATTAALLAEALYRLGRGDEAEELCTFVEENADPEDVASQFLWRGARAKLRAREGDHHAARELATEALRLTRSSDDVVAQANALVDCAQASALAGQTEAALEQLAEAEQLHAKKGNVVGAARARHLAALVAAGAEIPLVVT